MVSTALSDTTQSYLRASPITPTERTGKNTVNAWLTLWYNSAACNSSIKIASRQEVDRLYEDLGKTSPFDNRLQMIRVGLPPIADVDGVIGLGDGWLRKSDPPRLRHWAGRHPHFVQLCAFHLLETRAHGEEGEMEGRFYDDSAKIFRDLWSRLNKREQEHLRAYRSGQDTKPPKSLIRRGILESDGRPFGEILDEWLREEL